MDNKPGWSVTIRIKKCELNSDNTTRFFPAEEISAFITEEAGRFHVPNEAARLAKSLMDSDSMNLTHQKEKKNG